MPSLIACPNCGQHDYHKSHIKNIVERIRKYILHQRPYRCHDCNYRGWVLVKVERVKLSTRKAILYISVLLISIILGLIAGSTLN